MKAFFGWTLLFFTICFICYKISEFLENDFTELNIQVYIYKNKSGIEVPVYLNEVFGFISFIFLLLICVVVIIYIFKLSFGLICG